MNASSFSKFALASASALALSACETSEYIPANCRIDEHSAPMKTVIANITSDTERVAHDTRAVISMSQAEPFTADLHFDPGLNTPPLGTTTVLRTPGSVFAECHTTIDNYIMCQSGRVDDAGLVTDYSAVTANASTYIYDGPDVTVRPNVSKDSAQNCTAYDGQRWGAICNSVPGSQPYDNQLLCKDSIATTHAALTKLLADFEIRLTSPQP